MAIDLGEEEALAIRDVITKPQLLEEFIIFITEKRAVQNVYFYE